MLLNHVAAPLVGGHFAALDGRCRIPRRDRPPNHLTARPMPSPSTPAAPIGSPGDDRPWSLRDRRTVATFGAVLFLYVGLRAVAMAQAQFLEDHDSTLYLFQIDQIVSDGLGVIWSFNVDSAPFFPVVATPMSALTGSAELGARLTSLLFSGLMVLALFDIGRRMAGPAAVATGLLLVALNPTLAKLSFAVLTEPSFIATFYVAAWIFWLQFENPRLGLAALIGLVAGLAFTNRLEGILYLAFFPALQAVHYLWFSKGRYDLRRLMSWTAIFSACFAVFAVAEVARVSDHMGKLALNGRQAWVALLNDGTRSTDEAIYGLDYDPGTVNIEHVLANPLSMGDVESQVDPRAMVRRMVLNVEELSSVRLSELLGAMALALFGLGMLDLWLRGRRFEAVAVLGMIGVGFAAPIAHNVTPRHVAVVVPIMLLVAGLGVGYAARAISSGLSTDRRRSRALTVASLTLLAIGGWAYPLSVSLRGLDRPNMEYHPNDLVEPIRIVQSTQEELGRTPAIISRKAYLPYYAGIGLGLPMPYTDYEGLVEYSRINDADLLYLVYPGRRPFMSAFAGEGTPPPFELIYEGRSSLGQQVELYRLSDSAGGDE